MTDRRALLRYLSQETRPSLYDRIDDLERQLAEAREEIDALVSTKTGLTEEVEMLERELDGALADLRGNND